MATVLMVKQCEECGMDIEIMTHRDIERKRMCSRECRLKNLHRTGRMHKWGKGEDSMRWRGGKIKNSQGYVKIYTGHENGKAKYEFEHRVVMAEILGRPLRKFEQVHHLNGQRDDNRPENLELWVRNQPTGVRASDGHCPTCTCGR